jgi:hypothetical protein
MTAAQLALGLAMVTVGVAMIAGRQRIGQRQRRHAVMAAPMLWLFLGAVLAMNGLLQLLLAIA